jgi:hypothetical protein
MAPEVTGGDLVRYGKIRLHIESEMWKGVLGSAANRKHR